jgi:nicotinamidase-related amidase
VDRYTTPEFGSIALVVIDTQQDTLDGQPLEIAGTSAVVPRIGGLLTAFRSAGLPIVHMVRLYRENGSNADPCRRAAVEGGQAILRPGAPGSEPAKGLLPDESQRLDFELLLAGGIQCVGEREVVIYKPRWGAFFETPLEEHLRQMGVTTLAFAGCNFPNCPRTSIYEASERDFRVVLVADAVSGLYERGIEEMRGIGAAVMAAAELATAVGQKTR